jgi:peptidoglycan hydrolase CwlO-like protein
MEDKEGNVIGRKTGVIAQHVQKVLPEAVIEDEDGYLSVAYGNMMGLAINAIKELSSALAETNTVITANDEKMDNMKETIKKMQAQIDAILEKE